MVESPIGQRLKYLIKQLELDVVTFSKAIGVGDTTVRNYFNRGSKPNAEFFEKLINTFESVNLNWLLSGEGRMFTEEVSPVTNTATTRIKKVSGGAVHSGNGNQLITLEACQQELEQTKRDLASLQREIELLTGQLQTKDALIASKEETIDLLKTAFNRPN